MDQTLINIALALFIFAGGLIMGALGWFARTLWDRICDLERRQNAHEVKMAGEYVSNVDLAHAITDMKSVMQSMVHPIQSNIEYIRARVDGLPQRRQGDPNP